MRSGGPRPRSSPMSGPRQLVDVDWRGMEKLQRDLQIFARKAIPHAVRNGLTRTAYEARGEYIEAARSRLTLRNTWTERTIQVAPARGMVVDQMEARAGSTAQYMADQEAGKTEVASGKHGVPIPTSFSAGQGLKKKPRTRLVQRPNRLPAIDLASRGSARASRGRSSNRMQANAIAIRKALAAGSKYVFLDLRRRKGIFKLQGSKRGLKVRLVWDLSERSVRVRPTPMLLQAIIQTLNVAPRIQAAAMVEQLRRNKVFGY